MHTPHRREYPHPNPQAVLLGLQVRSEPLPVPFFRLLTFFSPRTRYRVQGSPRLIRPHPSLSWELVVFVVLPFFVAFIAKIIGQLEQNPWAYFGFWISMMWCVFLSLSASNRGYLANSPLPVGLVPGLVCSFPPSLRLISALSFPLPTVAHTSLWSLSASLLHHLQKNGLGRSTTIARLVVCSNIVGVGAYPLYAAIVFGLGAPAGVHYRRALANYNTVQAQLEASAGAWTPGTSLVVADLVSLQPIFEALQQEMYSFVTFLRALFGWYFVSASGCTIVSTFLPSSSLAQSFLFDLLHHCHLSLSPTSYRR